MGIKEEEQILITEQMSQKPHYPEDKKPFNLPHVALLVHFGNYHGGIVLDPSYTIILITTILITSEITSC